MVKLNEALFALAPALQAVLCSVWSSEMACVIPSGVSLFFLLCSWPLESISTSALCCQRHTATDRTHPYGHIKTWPPVTLLDFTCDVASSCYCMFSTLYKCAYECVSMRVCVCMPMLVPYVSFPRYSFISAPESKGTEPKD